MSKLIVTLIAVATLSVFAACSGPSRSIEVGTTSESETPLKATFVDSVFKVKFLHDAGYPPEETAEGQIHFMNAGFGTTVELAKTIPMSMPVDVNTQSSGVVIKVKYVVVVNEDGEKVMTTMTSRMQSDYDPVAIESQPSPEQPQRVVNAETTAESAAAVEDNGPVTYPRLNTPPRQLELAPADSPRPPPQANPIFQLQEQPRRLQGPCVGDCAGTTP